MKIERKKVFKFAFFVLLILLIVAGGLGFVITPTFEKLPSSENSVSKPFTSSSQIGCNYYRIPSLITTTNGSIIASVDARFGSTKDSPNNIDTAVSLSDNNGENWSQPELVLFFEDWENESKILKENGKLTTKNSASAIDPAMLQDEKTGRIFLMVDVFPYKTGAVNAQKGCGYTEKNSEKHLLLCKKGEKEYNYYADENGIIYNKDGEKTEYSLNGKFEILENGEPLTVKQKKLVYWYNLSFGINTKKEVPMNIMYKSSLFSPVPTSYIYMIYSDDNGKTWSDPVNLNSQIKTDNDSFMGVCPGRGIQIKSGENEGRLIFMTYYRDTQTAVQKFASVYSDDNGKTWKTGEAVSLTEEIYNLSETQLIQFDDGTLQSFSRSTIGKVVSSYSTDGGISWSKPFANENLPLSGVSGCQISVINYNGKIDGKDAVILSAPALDNRKNGYIYVGLITDNKNYEIQWKYKKEITDKDGDFAYSCLTQLTNGDIGILYENSNTPQATEAVTFSSYTIEELCTD